MITWVGSVRPVVCPRMIYTSTWYILTVAESPPVPELFRLYVRSELHTAWWHFSIAGQASMHTLAPDSYAHNHVMLQQSVGVKIVGGSNSSRFAAADNLSSR